MSAEPEVKEKAEETVELNVSPFQYLPPEKLENPDKSLAPEDQRLKDVISKFENLYRDKKNLIVVLPESMFKEIYRYDSQKHRETGK